MRTGRRSIQVAIAPAEWRTRCRLPRMLSIPDEARRPKRSWWRQYVALLDEGFVAHDHGGFYLRSDYDRARRTVCDCGEDMDFRGFEKRGPKGERLAYRPFAVCVMCGLWFEF
jgi:hypothetical protein